mmetsp:Transcript_7112/g.29075  ORF Transcript_7112/g.29075 Transcript_7112/m.29075 type:complete len:288 (-) Transcript_7112:91-954(-)
MPNAAAMAAGMNMLDHDDIAALKAYVRAPTGNKRAEGTVLLGVTHSNLQAALMEIRFDRHMTIATVKAKLVSHTGTNISAMRLLLRDENSNTLAALDDDSKMLGFYSPQDGMSLHVIDTDPTSLSAGGWLEDTSKVEKYKLSEEAYDAREKSYRKFKAEKLKEDPEWCIKKEMAMRRGEEYVPPNPELQKEEADQIKVGDRCKVEPGDRRATVRWVGNQLKALPAGYWVGVEYDEPHGKHNGTVKGNVLFECAEGHGAIVRPVHVTVGDFPEEEIDWDNLSGSDDEI